MKTIMKRVPNGATTNSKETLSQKNARVRKEMESREKRIETNQKEKEKNSYSNTRANKVVGKKMKTGGSLKPVAANQKGLAKLPKPVRNKMGYAKNGAATKMKSGGMYGMKAGGKIKAKK